MSNNDEATFDDVQIHVAAIAYYLYRLAGCPFGDNLPGYQAWMQVSLLEPFQQLSEQASDE